MTKGAVSSEIVVGLDLGSTKVSAVVGEIEAGSPGVRMVKAGRLATHGRMGGGE